MPRRFRPVRAIERVFLGPSTHSTARRTLRATLLGALPLLLAVLVLNPLTTSPSRQAQNQGQGTPSGSTSGSSDESPTGVAPSGGVTRPNPKATVPGNGSTSTAPEEGRTSRKAASPSPTTEEPPVTEEPSSTGEPSAEGPPEEKTSGEGTPSDELRPGGRRGSDLDPRFGTCKEANAHGYGPYVKGTDPEYRWYTDRDQDGIDCEPAHSRTP